jgi:hypothetical protein
MVECLEYLLQESEHLLRLTLGALEKDETKKLLGTKVQVKLLQKDRRIVRTQAVKPEISAKSTVEWGKRSAIGLSILLTSFKDF